MEEELKNEVLEYFKFHYEFGLGEVAGFKPANNKKKPKLKMPQRAAEEAAVQEVPLSLEALKAEILAFEGCALKRFATNTVIYDGIPSAKIMLIGEAPGEEEDLQGVPFCGKSGKLLDKALLSVALSRKKNIYITNSVFWRPPANRKPMPAELEACKPFLEGQINLIKPELIVCVGGVAVSTVLGSAEAITKMRRKIFEYRGIKTVAVYHPSYLLRNPAAKREMYIDLLWLKKNFGHLF